MNWKEIFKNNPLATEAMCEKFNFNGLEDTIFLLQSDDIRVLYDFFDEREIKAFYQSNAVLYIKTKTGDYVYTVDGWKKREEMVGMGMDKYLGLINTNKNRTQAETILFEKCFSILEKELKTNQDA